MFTLKMAQGNFFDREKVLRAVSAAKLRIFKDYGRKVRGTAQKSLTYADGSAPAGQPPHAHRSRKVTRKSKSTGKSRVRSVSFLREFLFFAYDPSSESVVVGPVKLGSTIDSAALPALERGGTATILSGGKRRSAMIRARPFMRPAAAAENRGLPAMWKDAVR